MLTEVETFWWLISVALFKLISNGLKSGSPLFPTILLLEENMLLGLMSDA